MMWKRNWIVQEEETAGEGSGAIGTSEPGAAVPAEPAELSTEGDVNWTEMSDDLDSEDEGFEVEGDEVVVSEPAKAEPVAPVAEPVPPVVPPVAPPPVQPVTPSPEPAAPAEPAPDYAAWRTNKVTELQSTYAISDDDAAALMTEPEVVLPKLMAQAHMEVLESAMRAMQAMMPVMMREMTQADTTNTQAKNMFLGVNPDLADPSYESAILELGSVYRKVNKTAPPDVAARAIGALVRSALGIAAPVAAQPGAPAPTVSAPAAPVPFTPARGGGTGGGAPAGSNEFTRLAEEFLNDDD